jgi:hypothetical protein
MLEKTYHRHPAAERHRLAAHRATRSTTRCRTSSSASSACAAATCCGSRAPTMPASPRRWWSSASCRAKGTDRRDLGREAFLERVWEWKAESAAPSRNQLRRLGASCDWSRERFTMDEGLSQAPCSRCSSSCYKEGLIYKDKRLVNWDPKLQTAISDLEVEQIEVKGNLWHLAIPLEGDATRVHRRRHHAARDDAGRHRRRRASRGRALQAPDRQAGRPAARRPPDPDRRRRVCRSREGHGRGEDHAGARLQRLRGRQAHNLPRSTSSTPTRA